MMAAAKTVLAAAILALGFSPPARNPELAILFYLDWRLEIVILNEIEKKLGTPPPAR